MKIEIITIGKLKKGAYQDLCAMYLQRIKTPIQILELDSKEEDESKQKRSEEKLLLEKIPQNCFCIALDERGKSLTSIAFSKKIFETIAPNNPHICFIIGGATGLGEQVLKRANFHLSFGGQTWPHQLVRIMLIEQIYRAIQIKNGHPYHKE